MSSRPFALLTAGCLTMIGTVSGAACSQPYAEQGAPQVAPEAGDQVTSEPDAATPLGDSDSSSDASNAPTDFVELARGLVEPGGVAATATTVYVTDRGSGRVIEVPVIGGAMNDLVGADNTSSTAIVAVNDSVFWANPSSHELKSYDTVTAVHGTFTIPAPQVVVAMGSALGQLVVLTTDTGSTNQGTIRRYGTDFSPGMAIAIQTPPFGLAVSGSLAYVTEPTAGNVTVITSSISVPMTGEPDCRSIAADASDVFWARPLTGDIRRGVSNGAGGASTLASGEDHPFSLAADDSGVYWLTKDGKLRRKRVDQELPPATLAAGLKTSFSDLGVQAIALTPSYVVWLTSDGRVLRLAK
jgi:hypothetical protein